MYTQTEEWTRYGYFGRCNTCGCVGVREFTFHKGQQVWCDVCRDVTSRKMGVALPYQREELCTHQPEDSTMTSIPKAIIAWLYNVIKV